MLYKRGQTWWYKFRFRGRLIQESSKETNRNRALEAERQCHNRLNDNYNGTAKRRDPILFSVAAERFVALKTASGKLKPRSIESMHSSLKHLLPAFGTKFLTDIDADTVNGYIGMRRAEDGASPKTAHIEIALLRSILIKHRLWGALRPDVELPSATKTVGRALTWEEQGLLLAACAASRCRYLYTIVVLALTTGLRRSELCSLRWQQINFTNRSLRVGESKTEAGENREIPLNTRALAVLEQWSASFPDRRPEYAVFRSEKHQDPMQPITGFKDSWETAKRSCGIKCRFHDLRHTAVTRMLEAGVPLSVVADLLGWSASTMMLMSKRYGHIGQSARAEAVKALNGPDSGAGWLQNELQPVLKGTNTVQ